MWVYIEEIDRMVEELEALGMWVEFKSRIISLTVSVSVKPATDEQKQSWSHSVTANEEQLETIRGLWGQDITRGEFMEKVFPESLEDMPEDILEGLYETKITWPDSSDQPGSMKCSLVWFRNITDFFGNENMELPESTMYNRFSTHLTPMALNVIHTHTKYSIAR